TIIIGSSFGGLAAAFIGLRHSEVFGKVISLSGSFWWSPVGENGPEWLKRQFAGSPKRRLQLFLERGFMEVPHQLHINRNMQRVLLDKGYPIHYFEFNGDHGYLNWRGGFSDGLAFLLEIHN